jgi:hypothetical protein
VAGPGRQGLAHDGGGLVLRGGQGGREAGDAGGQRGKRVGARDELEDGACRPPAPVAGRAVLQGGDEAGVQQGRLPRARGADEHHQPAAALGRAQLGGAGPGAACAAEEPAGVRLPVGRQTPVGAHAAGQRRGRVRGRRRPAGRGPLLLCGRRVPGVGRVGRVGQGLLPQALPPREVVQARDHRCGPRAPGRGNQDVQHRGERGELCRYVPAAPPVADPLGRHAHRPPAFVEPLQPHDRLGDAPQGRIAGLLVQQCESFREGRARP